jgi:hypothetical protein
VAKNGKYALGGKAPGEASDGVEAQGATHPHADAAKPASDAPGGSAAPSDEGGVLGTLKKAGRFIRGADRYTSEVFGQAADGLKNSVISAVTAPRDAIEGKLDPRSDAGIDRIADMGLTIGGSALALPGEKGALGMFAGRKAANAPQELALARPGMADAERRALWKDHLVDTNRDRQPMWEFSDHDAVYKGRPKAAVNRADYPDVHAYLAAKDAYEAANPGMLNAPPTTMKLGELLDHPKLYAAYPEMRDMTVRFDPQMKANEHGFYDRGSKTITLNPAFDNQAQLNTILHEGQHHIQNVEGWQGGSNLQSGERLTNQARDFMNKTEGMQEAFDALQAGKTPAWINKQIVDGNMTGPSAVIPHAKSIYADPHGPAVMQGVYNHAVEQNRFYRDPFQNYQRFDGEVQARNTGNAPEPGFQSTGGRRNLDEAGRRENYWKDTEDYPGEDRISGPDLGQRVPFAQGGFIEGRNDNDGPKATARDLLGFPNRKGANTWEQVKDRPQAIARPELPTMGQMIRPANEKAEGGMVNEGARERLLAHLAKGGKPPAIPNENLSSAAKEVLRFRAAEMEKPKSKRLQPNGAEPVFDTSRDAYEQTQKIIPQEDKSHLYPRLDDDAEGPKNDRSRPLVEHRMAIADQIAQDIEPLKDSNVRYFYHSGPIAQRNIEDGLSPEESIGSLRSMMGYNSATSPRTETEQNLRNGTLLHMFDRQGLAYQGGKSGNLKGYPMMDMHLDLSRQFRDGTQDIGTNTKPGFFKENTAGNLAAGVTGDTHNIRGTLMALNKVAPGSIPDEWFGKSEDIDPNDPDAEAKAEAAAKGALAQYRQNPEAFNPAKGIADSVGKSVVDRGQRPQQTEYRRIVAPTHIAAQKLGVSPAEAQSMMWFGYGKNTGLKSQPKTLVDLINDRVNVTAQALGLPPAKVWAMVRNGDIPLLKEGGEVRA